MVETATPPIPGPPPRSLKLLFAASEAAPFAKTGGLGDVVGALPRALAERGHQCTVFLPLYNACRQAGVPLQPTDLAFTVPVGGKSVPGRLWRSQLPCSKVTVYLVEQEDYFGRDDPADGRGFYQLQLAGGRLKDYPDNCARFVFFSRAILEALPLLQLWPDVIHANDWQTGLLPVYLKELYRDRPYAGLPSLFTVHNLAYQGLFWHWDMNLTGLDWKLFNWRQLEFYGHLNLLKGGIVFADMVSTVSPRYAEEIQTPEYGCGLEGVLRDCRHKLVGIVNGVDYAHWDPATDPHIVARYNSATVVEGKAACKAALQRRLGLPRDPARPLLGMISRLVEQKGVDLLTLAAGDILKLGVQLVVLGTGDAMHHQALTNLASGNPEQVAVVLGFDEPLAHQIEAGADVFLMPSRFEPSGLNQLYSLRYGTIPVVRDTGGLSDTVTDVTPLSLAAGTATGFVFREYKPAAFLEAVRRAVAMFRDHPEQWRQVQRTGMGQDWSWQQRAAAYEDLYRRVMSARRGPLAV